MVPSMSITKRSKISHYSQDVLDLVREITEAAPDDGEICTKYGIILLADHAVWDELESTSYPNLTAWAVTQFDDCDTTQFVKRNSLKSGVADY